MCLFITFSSWVYVAYRDRIRKIYCSLQCVRGTHFPRRGCVCRTTTSRCWTRSLTRTAYWISSAVSDRRTQQSKVINFHRRTSNTFILQYAGMQLIIFPKHAHSLRRCNAARWSRRCRGGCAIRSAHLRPRTRTAQTLPRSRKRIGLCARVANTKAQTDLS